MLLTQYKFIDLTHTLSQDSSSWGGGCGYTPEVKLDYHQCNAQSKFRVQQIKMHAGIGTHIDAPAHCIEDGVTVDQIPLQDLISSCMVIDVSSKANEHYLISDQDLIEFETKHQPIPADTFVIFYTGWEQHWQNPNQYRNNMLFPTVSEAAAELLLERNIRGIAIDTLSPDLPTSNYPVHRLLLGAGKYIIENIANAAKMPATGGHVMCLPFKGKDLTESPTRVIGLLPR